MSRILTTMTILDQEGETSRLEYIVVENMVGNAFPNEASNKYWGIYLKTRDEFKKKGLLDGSLSEENTVKIFEGSSNLGPRLELLKEFISGELALFNLISNQNNSGKKNIKIIPDPKKHGGHLVDEREA